MLKKGLIIEKSFSFSKIGFVLATAGSAVGLGNIWRFPYITGEYGGGAFVLVYLAALFAVSFPLLIGEIFLGQMGKKDPVSSYEFLAPNGKKYWKFAGFVIVTAILILSFYNVVIGWILYYAYLVLTDLPQDIIQAKEVFTNMVANGVGTQILFFSIGSLLVAWIVYKGVDRGIQKLNLFLMPALILILLFMFVYSMSLDSFKNALYFMFEPNFSKLTPQAILVAVGQAFFTVSVGVGVIMTYASFSKESQNIFRSSLWIIIIDTFIAIIAGVMSFAFLFNSNLGSSQSVGLAFMSMPIAFVPFGNIGVFLAFLFFVALAFASITSAISLLEAPVTYLTQRHKLKRTKATIISALLVYVLGLFALLSLTKDYSMQILGKSIFDTLDFITAAILMPIGGLLIAFFIGFVLKKEDVYAYLSKRGLRSRLNFSLWYYSLKIISPIIIVVVILNQFGVL